MADPRARLQAGERGGARVAEQVQHADGPAGPPDFFRREVPVHGLLREKAGVLEAHQLQPEAQVPVPDLPRGGHGLSELPVPPARRGAQIARVGAAPQRIAPGRVPDNLRVGADQHDAAPFFQPLARGGVDQSIVFPVCGSQSIRSFRLRPAAGGRRPPRGPQGPESARCPRPPPSRAEAAPCRRAAR